MTTPRPIVMAPTRLCVVGAGYVGLTAAACMAESGHSVTCLEASPARLSILQRGGIPIVEPRLAEMVDRNRQAGRLRFTSDIAEALDGVSHALLCVGTPPRADGTPDLTQIAGAARQLASTIRTDLVLIVKSTVPPGTCEALEILAAEAAQPGVRVRVVSNPEFLRESRAVYDFFAPDRIVVGADDAELGRGVADLYPPGPPVVLCDRRSAELIKYAANTFLAVKISFANEVAQLCDALGTEAAAVLAGVGADHRIGREFLRPGPGYGGSCLPKDVAGFVSLGAAAGTCTDLAEAAEAQNTRARHSVVERLDSVLGGLAGRRIGVLGLAFKDGTDDTRDSPGLQIVEDLVAAGADVATYDPLVDARLPAGSRMPTPADAVSGADAIVVTVASDEYRALDPMETAESMAGRVVFDAAGVLDLDVWGSAGLTVYGVGRGVPHSFYPVVWTPLRWTTARRTAEAA